MPRIDRRPAIAEHMPENAMHERDEITRFYDRCSDLMRELLNALAATPGEPRPFSEVERALGWPRRRIASVLGGVWHLRTSEFSGRRPYRFVDERHSPSGRWEIWCDAEQASAVEAARGADASEAPDETDGPDPTEGPAPTDGPDPTEGPDET